MKSPFDILSQRMNVMTVGADADHGYVYALVCKGEIVYVGSTSDLSQRIGNHSNRMEFDRVLWVSRPLDECLAWEGALIRALSPRHNTRAPSYRGNDNEVLSLLGLPLHADERAVADARHLRDYPPYSDEKKARIRRNNERLRRVDRSRRTRAFAGAK